MGMTVEEIKNKLPEFGEVGESALLIIQLLEIQIENYKKLVKELEEVINDYNN